ncbi:MAG: hypothetical protein VB084_04225 [Syntrophomonadaceae bacterium]|nr:hypothetical protein [Syntrophomonadaceae bacterium]
MMKLKMIITMLILLVISASAGCAGIKSANTAPPANPEPALPATASTDGNDSSGISIGPPVTEIYDPNQTQKNIEMVYVTGDGGLNYHRTGCKYLNGEIIALGLDEAKEEGYTPCPYCKPTP